MNYIGKLLQLAKTKTQQIQEELFSLKLLFEGSHGCKSSFDGVGGELAHAFYPRFGGNIHFDADERWGDTSGTKLLSVAVHEIGHSLGLSHSNIYNSVMYAIYRNRKTIALDDDDKAGIEAIYGKILLLICHAVILLVNIAVN